MVTQKIVKDRLPFRKAMDKSTEGGRAGAGEAKGIGSESAGTSAKEGGTATR